MNTWVSYAEDIEAMEQQLNKSIETESLHLFLFQLNGMLLQCDTPELNLMQSINSKDLTHYYKGWLQSGSASVAMCNINKRIDKNKQVMKQYKCI